MNKLYKQSVKSMIVACVCMLCLAASALIGCEPNYRSFYNDLDALNNCQGEFGVDWTFDGGEENLIPQNHDGSREPETYSIDYKGFSGIKCINTIKINVDSEDSIEYIRFTRFNMRQGKLKLFIANRALNCIFKFEDFTPAMDGVLCEWRLKGLATSDEIWSGEVDVKLAGVDAEFDFALQFMRHSDNIYPEEKPNDPSEPDDPSNPDDPSEPADSRFEEIETAYRNADYDVDLTADNVDASMQALINSTKDMYSALGYDLCYIGKNLDNALSAELYMLISTDSEESTKEIADAYEGTYKYAVSGRDIIVSIWPIGTPNFAPFESAAI